MKNEIVISAEPNRKSFDALLDPVNSERVRKQLGYVTQVTKVLVGIVNGI